MKSKFKGPRLVKPVVDNYTHVLVLIDRSGSMEHIRDDVVGGLNRFVREQRQAPGRCTMTLVQFDSQDPYEILHDCVDVQAMPPIGEEYQPRGGTPLYDAMGRGITELAKAVEKMGGDLVATLAGRPGKPRNVVVVVVTDGLNNDSKRFTSAQVKALTKEKEAAGWHFVYLGANQDAIEVGESIGVAKAGAATYTPQHVSEAMHFTSQNLSSLRACAVGNMAYSNAQRAAMVGLAPSDGLTAEVKDRMLNTPVPEEVVKDFLVHGPK